MAFPSRDMNLAAFPKKYPDFSMNTGDRYFFKFPAPPEGGQHGQGFIAEYPGLIREFRQIVLLCLQRGIVFDQSLP